MITRMFLKEAVATIGVGVITGSAIVLAVGRIIAALLFAVTPTDPISFGVAVGVVVLVAFAASYLPVRHALRFDPAMTLRR